MEVLIGQQSFPMWNVILRLAGGGVLDRMMKERGAGNEDLRKALGTRTKQGNPVDH
jgi:hypothetical protein